jgi:hypothetical protein
MQEYDLIIVVMACDTKPKYKDQILKIEETYGKLIHSMPTVKLLYFLGEEVGLEGEQYIHCKGVTNDYNSVSVKQFHGLKYVHEHFNTKFVMCIGSDTYLNVKKLLLFLKSFDSSKSLYIGGHGCFVTIQEKSYYYHGGGPGFILSKPCLKSLYPKIQDIDTFLNEWFTFRMKDYPDFLGACDLWMGILAEELGVDFIFANGFYFCNFIGFPCHIQQFNFNEIISCHCMGLEDCDMFTKILEANNYFV